MIKICKNNFSKNQKIEAPQRRTTSSNLSSLSLIPQIKGKRLMIRLFIQIFAHIFSKINNERLSTLKI
jgi:hypothetical protein